MTEQILYDSDQAATYRTGIEGWVCSKGYYHGNSKSSEHLARWSGSTHVKCECGAICSKHYTLCRKCREKKEDEKFNSMEKAPWDGESPVCIYGTDTYFFNGIDEIEVYCDDYGVKKENLQLCHCCPIELPEFDVNDHFCDVMAEDSDYIPQDIIDAAEDLNEAIRAAAPLSWRQGSKAVKWGGKC